MSLGSGTVALLLPSIAVGSTIRRVEDWLDRGGLSDRLPTARRGLHYEAWVRQEAEKAIAGNKLLSAATCAVTSIASKSGGEQIDLLIRLGKLLVVAEVKCLLAPAEAMGHYNYLVTLQEAGTQAVRKARWIEGNLGAVATALKTSEEDVRSLRHVPIVVTNQGMGFGLTIGGAQVVDFHFLKLYLADDSYIAGAAVRFSDGTTALKHEVLYRTAEEAELKFEATMADPPPMKRYLDAAIWKENQFPLSDGGTLSVAGCFMGEGMKEELVALNAQLS